MSITMNQDKTFKPTMLIAYTQILSWNQKWMKLLSIIPNYRIKTIFIKKLEEEVSVGLRGHRHSLVVGTIQVTITSMV